jgi:hypothetical protein
MNTQDPKEQDSTEKDGRPATTLPGTVQKIIPSLGPDEPEKAEIVLDDGEPLYREIRIENVLQDEDGEELRLKPGAAVDITVEADENDTVKR